MATPRRIAASLICVLIVASVIIYLFLSGQLGWMDPDLSIVIISLLGLITVSLSVSLGLKLTRRPKKRCVSLCQR